jgi:hypothetical protein
MPAEAGKGSRSYYSLHNARLSGEGSRRQRTQPSRVMRVCQKYATLRAYSPCTRKSHKSGHNATTVTPAKSVRTSCEGLVEQTVRCEHRDSCPCDRFQRRGCHRFQHRGCHRFQHLRCSE